jgi:Protein of unknown function (DUF3828)
MRTGILVKVILCACVGVAGYPRYYKDGPGLDFAGPRANRFLHSSLIALIQEDAKAAGPGQVGVLDGDPVCGCQDWDGIYRLKIEIKTIEKAGAQTLVSFDLSKNPGADAHRSLVITLVSEKVQWRIYDVLDQSDPKAPFALREALTREIHDAKRPR